MLSNFNNLVLHERKSFGTPCIYNYIIILPPICDNHT